MKGDVCSVHEEKEYIRQRKDCKLAEERRGKKLSSDCLIKKDYIPRIERRAISRLIIMYAHLIIVNTMNKTKKVMQQFVVELFSNTIGICIASYEE